MIARYSRPEMTRVWEDRARYRIWLQVELEACRQMATEGVIPRKDWRALDVAGTKLLKAGGVDPARVEHFEAITRHDIIAFTTAVAERIGPVSRYIHFGLTSSDIVDTALSIQISQAGELLVAQVRALLRVLDRQARVLRSVPTIGRSHGIYAEPTSFGLKFLGWKCEWERNLSRLETALEGCRVGKLSGAVGVNAHWDPEFEEKVLKRLGLRREPVSTQVVPRDRHAELLLVFAICGSSLERIAVELRHLQRSEVGEVLESFKKGQKGSSAMPHKRNPVLSENLTGLARLVRAAVIPALENVALWHERDISHSSVERGIAPDATVTLDFALVRLTGLMDKLVVYPENMIRNLDRFGGLVHSQRVLLALTQAGLSREASYSAVQRNAMQIWREGGSFLDLLANDPEVAAKLSRAQLAPMFDLGYHTKHVDTIFARVFKP
jgi:adenylosuccinate lyase